MIEIERWAEERDGPLSKAAMRAKLEGRYRVSIYTGDAPVVSLDAVRS